MSSDPRPSTAVPGYNPHASGDPSTTEPGRSDSASDGGRTATAEPSSVAEPASGPGQSPEANLIIRQYNALSQQVEALERRFPGGDIPLMPSIYGLEYQFHRLLADRMSLHVPLNPALESEIATRIRALFAQVQGPRPDDPMYILGDCSGRQYLVTPGLNDGGSAAPNPAHAPGAAGDPAARAAMFDDAARQLILNHQRSFMRRIWLLGRLWLLSYLLSGSGTWTRLIFVILSALFAIFMETHYPQRLYDLIIRPVQRHLEELTHMGRPRQPATAPDDHHNAGLGRRDRLIQEIWGYLRAVERAVVLLLASLIPGVGERQVEARNAAEAAAERARQEEQERERGPEPAVAEQTDEQPQPRSQQVATGDQ